MEKAAEFLALPTHGPRGEALYTGHVCRKTGAEARTAAGIEVAITQVLSCALLVLSPVGAEMVEK